MFRIFLSVRLLFIEIHLEKIMSFKKLTTAWNYLNILRILRVWVFKGSTKLFFLFLLKLLWYQTCFDCCNWSRLTGLEPFFALQPKMEKNRGSPFLMRSLCVINEFEQDSLPRFQSQIINKRHKPFKTKEF